jgi:hypothetical protein
MAASIREHQAKHNTHVDVLLNNAIELPRCVNKESTGVLTELCGRTRVNAADDNAGVHAGERRMHAMRRDHAN